MRGVPTAAHPSEDRAWRPGEPSRHVQPAGAPHVLQIEHLLQNAFGNVCGVGPILEHPRWITDRQHRETIISSLVFDRGLERIFALRVSIAGDQDNASR